MKRKEHLPTIFKFNKFENTNLYKFGKNIELDYETPRGFRGLKAGDGYSVLKYIQCFEKKIILVFEDEKLEFEYDGEIEESIYIDDKLDVAGTTFKNTKYLTQCESQYEKGTKVIYEDNRGFDLELHWRSNELKKSICLPEEKYTSTTRIENFEKSLFFKYLDDVNFYLETPKGFANNKEGQGKFAGIKIKIIDDQIKIKNWYHYEITIYGATSFTERIDSLKERQELIFQDVKKIEMSDLETNKKMKEPKYENSKGFNVKLFWLSYEYKKNFYRKDPLEVV